ncbi:putative cell wall binding protein [Lachnospiraceae bacterium JC7]|nr:putative cell wall binding protein [Lachnospiraceae bacterium JC7]
MKKQTKLFTTLSAAALLTIGVSAVSMAAGWDNSTGEWRYLNNDGTEVTDTWKSANGNWFYLGSDGVMATNQLIEDNSNSKTRYYYVDQYGAMVKNTWKAVAKDDGNDNLDAEYWWYYFGSDGKAYTAEAPLSSSKIKTINGLKYAFNDEGHMLYGWISKDNLQQQDEDEDAWSTSQYFFNGWNDGHMQTGWIQLTVKDTNVKEDQDETQTYWFHFKNSGEKRTKSAKINGTRYYFAEDGHMFTDWAKQAANATSYSIKDGSANGLGTDSVVYVNGDGSQRKNKWVYAIPDEDFIKKDYEDDEYRWFYFKSSGKLATDEIKKINGKNYAFDENGVMKVGFVTTDSDKHSVAGLGKGDKWTRDAILAGTNTEGKSIDTLFFYFSDNEEKDGSMKKGYQTIELDDNSYQFYFNTSNGEAKTEYSSKIKKYIKNGLVLAPIADDESNYAAVKVDGNNTPDGARCLKFGKDTEGNILVNRSGSVMKSKTKLKDSNDAYYIVNAAGVVLAYYDSEDAYNKATQLEKDDKKKTVNVSELLKKDEYKGANADPIDFQNELELKRQNLFK